MSLPPGLDSAVEGKVCKLKKTLIQYGFLQSSNDHSTIDKDDNYTSLFVYVDDIILTGTCATILNDVMRFIHMQLR